MIWLAIGIGGSCWQPASLWADDIQAVVAGIDERIERHRKRDVTLRVVTQDGEALSPQSPVRVQLTRHAFHFGCNLFAISESNQDQKAEYLRQFVETMNSATLPFYWSSYEAQPGVTEQSRWRAAAQWCQSNDIWVKGHPLVWNLEPEWVKSMAAGQAEERMWNRVVDLPSEFRNLIDAWDVINETTEGVKHAKLKSAATLLAAYRRDGVQRCIEKAFRLARQGDPNALLVINDYVTTDHYAAVIQQAIDDDVDFDVIGIQSHMHEGYWGAQKIWDVCNRFAKFQKPLHFTELTILSGRLKDRSNQDWSSFRPDWVTTKEREKTQAQQVYETYRLLFSHPAVEGIFWWDLWDEHAWMMAPGGLLRRDLTPKPAFQVVRNLIRDRWALTLQPTVDIDGRCSIRGFYGDYVVDVAGDDGSMRGTFSLTKSSPAEITVSVE